MEDSRSITESDWQRLRTHLPVTRKWAYFDHAAVGPLTQACCEAMQIWLDEATQEGDTAWPIWHDQLRELRSFMPKIIGAHEDEIAFVPNTTTGINLVAEGFPWQPGDSVVTLENEFPSNLLPWLQLRQQGVDVRLVPCDNGNVSMDQVIAACDQTTRIVSLSWVGFASGYRLDLQEAAERIHQTGALFFLDAIQGMGVFPLDLQTCPIDFLAADGHKWMLGPEGAGIFFVRREHLETLRPRAVGWNSVDTPFQFDVSDFRIRPSAARYEGGTMNQAGFIGLLASLKLLHRFGLNPQSTIIGQRATELANELVEKLSILGAEWLSPMVPDHSSGIVNFLIPGKSSASIRKSCMENGVVVSCRGGGVRASVHCYNNSQDIDRLVDAVKACL